MSEPGSSDQTNVGAGLPAATVSSHALLTLDFAPAQDGGVAALMEAAAEGLHLSGCPVQVLTRRAPGALALEAAARDAALGAQVRRMWGRSWRAQHRLWLRLQLPRLLAQVRPDVLHLDSWPLMQAALAPARRAGARVWVWTHARELFEPQADTGRRAALAAADRVIATHSFGARRLQELGVASDRLSLVSPTPTLRYVQADADRARARSQYGVCGPTLLTVARLVRRKGHATVLEALPALCRAHPGLRWLVAGQGVERASLQRQVRALGLDAVVDLLGHVPEAALPDLYAAADIFVMPHHDGEGTDLEGFGLVFAEAAWAGLPCVVGSSGGVPETVLHGVTGLVLDDSRAPGQVGEAIDALLRRPELAARMGAAARARAQRLWNPEALGLALQALAADDLRGAHVS